MFVYFIRSVKRGGPIKIGYAKNINERLLQLQTGNPLKLTVVAKIPVDTEKEAQHMENWFHDRFRKKRLRGEWFKGSIKVKAIESGLVNIKDDKSWDEVRRENGGRLNV